MGSEKIEALRHALLEGLNRQWTLAQLSAPAGFKELNRADIAAFIRTAARARLTQLEEFGTTASVGRELFSRYLLSFEAASILLLAAIVGVLLLARRSPDEGGSR
jgi:NADH:ubiquinone oxidoreductase subunit 6 (subunit J)